MIFKVYYQENKVQVPVRERTKSLYIEAESEKEVREKLSDTPYNIEHIQPLDGAYLEYEQNQENFKLMG
jgi:DNA-dependent RNA polymerase auxiliary subunit epsilon